MESGDGLLMYKEVSSNIKRWTNGKPWSASRISPNFFFCQGCGHRVEESAGINNHGVKDGTKVGLNC